MKTRPVLGSKCTLRVELRECSSSFLLTYARKDVTVRFQTTNSLINGNKTSSEKGLPRQSLKHDSTHSTNVFRELSKRVLKVFRQNKDVLRTSYSRTSSQSQQVVRSREIKPRTSPWSWVKAEKCVFRVGVA